MPTTATNERTKLGVLGAGQMARALVAGWVESGLLGPGDVVAFDPSDTAWNAFEQGIGEGVQRTADAAAAAGAETLLLAVKPQYIATALKSATAGLSGDTLVVSIAAGVTIDSLGAAVPEGTPVVRVMPNTPCLVGRGACVYSAGPGVTDEQRAWVGRLFGAVGFAAEAPENLLDAVTGVSGSGPAYIYTVIEALADGGVRAGLPRELALNLATHTVAGAAAMVAETGTHPAALRDAVTSPGGTTIAAVGELERRGLRAALIEAVGVAAGRARELGRG
ncbi:MAG: pyrroline-5-carboxylate reductase [Planctomycetota bacterium]